MSVDSSSTSTNDIHFATRAKKLDNGLSERLNDFLAAHPNTRLVIIDTLQYIRNTGKAIGTYSKDYRDTNTLRGIIDGRNLAMLSSPTTTKQTTPTHSSESLAAQV